MTAVYTPYTPAVQRNVHFGSQTTVSRPSNPYAAGQLYKQTINNPYAAGRADAQSTTASPAPVPETRRPLDLERSKPSEGAPRPALPPRQTYAATAPLVRKGGNDYFGISTSQRPRQAESATALALPRLGGPRSYTTDSLLNDFLSLPPLTVTLEALFYYRDDGRSSRWFLAQNLPLHLVKTVAYTPRQYVDGIVPPQCISAAFIQQKVHIRHDQFDAAEKKSNKDKQSALHSYGAKQIDQWGKKIRAVAEIDYPRKMAWLGARPRENGNKVFKVLSATTLWDMFPNIPNLPANYNGNRQGSYVKR